MGRGVTLRAPVSIYAMFMGNQAVTLRAPWLPIFIEKTGKPYLDVTAGMVLRTA